METRQALVFGIAKLKDDVASQIFTCQAGRDSAPGMFLADDRIQMGAAEFEGAEDSSGSRVGESGRAAHTAKTMGSPVISVHSAPRSRTWNGRSRGSSRSAGSPMIRQASASSSMLTRSGRRDRTSGSAPNLRLKMIRLRATEVRELESAASVRIWENGSFEMSRMLRTGPRQAMPAPANNMQLLVRQLDRRHDTDIGGSSGESVGAFRRQSE